jgi:hypothetical protein
VLLDTPALHDLTHGPAPPIAGRHTGTRRHKRDAGQQVDRLNGGMTTIADLPAAASVSVAALAGYTELDWRQVPAADLQWSCWQTTLHMVDCLYFYTMQVIYGQLDGYLCTELALDDSASPPRLLAALSAHAELLHRITRSADPDLRAHHNYGASDPAGFAAMGVVETLIHTFDVVRGLNPADQWRPPAALAAPVIARLFPHAPSGDPAEVLLYCCGRAALGEMPRQAPEWQWDGTVRT